LGLWMSMFDFTRNWGKIRLAILGISIAFIGVAGVFLPQSSSANAGTAAAAGFQAPDFQLASTLPGNIRLSDFRGKPVILNLWASWCPPCKSEMPALQRVYDQYQSQGLVVLAVNMTSQDSLQDATQFIEEKHLTFPVLWDESGLVADLYQMRALPTTYFIRPDGKIDQVVIGGPLPEGFLFSKAIELLGEMQ